MSGITREMLPSSASLSTRCPLPKPSPAVWRSPASPAARAPQSRLPVAGSPARSWRVVDSPGTNSSTWSQPGSLPRSTGGKATRIPRRKERASAPPARVTPPPTALREPPDRAELSTYLPGRLLPARSAALAAGFSPGGPRLPRAVALRSGVSFLPRSSALPPRVAVSVFPLELALRPCSSARRLGPCPVRPAPPRARLRPGVPSLPPRRGTGWAFGSCTWCAQGAGRAEFWLRWHGSPVRRVGPFEDASASSHRSVNETSVAGVRWCGF